MTRERSASCARVEERLAALVDGALAPLAEARDRGHLEACEACRSALARHERLLASIRTAAWQESAREAELVAAAVFARLEALAPPAPRSLRAKASRSWAVGLIAAAAAVLLLALLQRAPGMPSASSIGLEPLDHALERLPSWMDIVRGLEGLARELS